VIEKTITIFRNKKPKNLKFGLLGIFRFFKKPKKPRFLKATSTALVDCDGLVESAGKHQIFNVFKVSHILFCSSSGDKDACRAVSFT